MDQVRAFMVTGETSALLIDTGPGGIDVRAAAIECTALPVRVVNTHSHYDHISGNSAFDMLFAHPFELSPLAKAGFLVHPVGDGAGFDLGGRILQTLLLPGHSPGSLALWDAEEGLFFAGDIIAVGRPVFLCLDGASIEAYIRSMDRLLSIEDENSGAIRRIFCAHGDVETNMASVHALKECAERVLEGSLEKKPLPEKYRPILGEGVGIYQHGNVSILA